MTRPRPVARAGAAAQLRDAARAARQVAAGRETAQAPSPPPAPDGPAAAGPGNAAPTAPTQPATRQQPSHPVHTLTARELREYRRELEQALNCLPARAPVRDLLQRHLAEVRAEQDARAQPASPSGKETAQ
jgi:hypothetical protein